MVIKITLMNQISACHKKPVGGTTLYSSTGIVFRYSGRHAARPIIEIGTHYNYIPYISALTHKSAVDGEDFSH